MKEATGDMTMTIVVIVGVLAVLALAPTIWGAIAERINTEIEEIEQPEITYVEVIDNYNI